MCTVFWWVNLKERDHLKDLGVDEDGNIKIGFKELVWEGVDCINLVQERDKWRALVNTVMYLRVL
jgi:hypothetical protein